MARAESSTTASRSTAAQILDAAERLVQERGFNGFSYADIASELGVTKAASTTTSRPRRPRRRADRALRRAVLRGARSRRRRSDRRGREAPRVREAVRRRVPRRPDVPVRDARRRLRHPPRPDARAVAVLRRQRGLALRVLEEGRAKGTVRFEGSARPVARTLIGGLEGAMLVARPYHDLKRFRDAADLLIGGLAVER